MGWGGWLLAAVSASQMGTLDAPPKPKSYVVYAAELQVVPANRKAVLELHFRVLPGYHVNSHTPKSELLIPTRLEVQGAQGVQGGVPEYPAGKAYSFAFSPTEPLDVYAGDLTVKLPVTATPGEHALPATLKYQACDNAACYPPKSLPVQIVFTAR